MITGLCSIYFNIRLQECRYETALSRLEHSQYPSLLVSGLLKYIFNMKCEICCVSHHFGWISDLFFFLQSCLNYHVICWVLQFLFHPFPILQKFELAGIEFHIVCMCPDLKNIIIATGCPLHLLFLEGFEYHQWSMVLSSPVFCYLYQIYVFSIWVDLTPTLGVRHY